ncbi:MAG: gamma-glutamyl-gamma-aminobutyrate hydrolase family protein [Desulfitobacteriaceae bacterium]
MSKKPVIGISVAHCQEELITFPRENYVRCIKAAGGIPILIPPLVDQSEALEMLNLIDGLLLSGGGDISPALMGEFPERGIGCCFPERDLGELLLAKLAFQQDTPVLGICRGIQIMAVAAGGKIYQDISQQLSQSFQHKQTAPRQYPWHEVKILDSRLGQILGEENISVNSFHHQAIKKIPEGFCINALSSDGIIEGFEKIGARFCLGVQWHPESMPNEVHSYAIFKGFLAACRS